MIHLLTRPVHAHSGMETYGRGIANVGAGWITVLPLSDAERIQLSAGDCVLFDDRVGDDGLDRIACWADRSGISYGVLLHSPLLQMDLSNELEYTLSLLDDRGDGRTLDVVACADEGMASLLREACPGSLVEWLPHCLPEIDRLLEVPLREEPPADFTCWLPLTLPDRDPFYRHKNPYCQLAGATRAANFRDRELRVACSFVSGDLRRFGDRLGLALVETGSMKEDAFRFFLSEVGVGLCVSLSESFSYNAAELMLLGVPTLFGPAIRWAWRCPELGSLCGVEDPGSVDEIAHRLSDLIVAPGRYARASTLVRQAALAAARHNHERALATLRTLGGVGG
jgi:hypothetical protein